MFINCSVLKLYVTTVFISKKPYNILTSPDTSALPVYNTIVARFVFCTQAKVTIIPLKVEQMTPLSIKQSLLLWFIMVSSPPHRITTAFSSFKASLSYAARNFNYEVSNNIICCHSTQTIS